MDNYEHYESLPVRIRATGPIAERVLCRTHGGPVWAEVGHYIVQEPDGIGEYPLDPETFRRWYRRVAPPAALAPDSPESGHGGQETAKSATDTTPARAGHPDAIGSENGR
jgi:hypothetical protein